MITIWKAKVNSAKMPAYHAEATLAGVAFGASARARIAPTNVSRTANTYGSGIRFSNR